MHRWPGPSPLALHMPPSHRPSSFPSSAPHSAEPGNGSQASPAGLQAWQGPGQLASLHVTCSTAQRSIAQRGVRLRALSIGHPNPGSG